MIKQATIAGCCLWLGFLASAQAAAPSVGDALKLEPIQKGIDYSSPSEVAKCTISVRKFGAASGWVVDDPSGVPLRRFVDTNNDNYVDQWSYFKDGIEVYRDIDSNFNGKADQYRWFNTAGTRWADDKNEDGRVDNWRTLSAEEATAEIVAALAARDVDRFAVVAVSESDLPALGLGREKADKLREKISSLAKDFRGLASRQGLVGRDTQWTHFSGSKPGLVPAGTDGSTKDLRVYEQVMAIVDTSGKAGQVPIGTLVETEGGWRVIDVPAVSEGEAASPPSGFFFQMAQGARPEGPSGQNDELQKLIEEMQKLDEAIAKATEPQQRSSLVGRRAELLEKLAEQSAEQEQVMWYQQLANMLSGEVQSGAYPEGTKQLAALFKKLENKAPNDLVANIRMHQLTAEYLAAMQAPKRDVLKIQSEWLQNLEKFTTDYPKSPDAAEAMLQLGITREYSAQEDEAVKWYARIVKEFPQSMAAQKAAGAQVRLQSEGKTIGLSGKGLTGGNFDVSRLRGKPVLIHYWANWSEPSKSDVAAIKEIVRKYGSQLNVLGVNLDVNQRDANAFVAEAKINWPQIWEEGGLDSRAANQLGILTVPTMILLDAQGKVVNRAVGANDLEAEIKKVVK